MPDLSVIILTFNEAPNIVRALESVCGWAKEVFVVDSFSTDDTVDLALGFRDRGVTAVQHRFDGWASQWQWALQHLPLTGAWTMKLDADEFLPEAMRDRVAEAITTARQSTDAFYLRLRHYFMGRPLRFGGLSKLWFLRLWRTGRAQVSPSLVNEHMRVPGQVALFNAVIHHDDKKPLSHWLRKHDLYSSLAAKARLEQPRTPDIVPNLSGRPEQRRRFLKRLYERVPGRVPLYFLVHYFLRLGFLDGATGFRFWWLRTMYRYWIELKVREHKQRGLEPVAVWPPRGKPHPEVAADNLDVPGEPQV